MIGDSAVNGEQGSVPIFGFMHVAMHGNWRTVVTEQFTQLGLSGLYENSGKIYVGLLGASPQDFPVRSPKVEIVHTSENFKEYELPTLQFLHRFCQEHDGLVYYIHTKGVFRDTPNTRDWRHFMEHYVINRFRDCVKCLRTHDICGVEWLDKPWPHFSGNFWWSTAAYIRRLQPPQNLPIALTGDLDERRRCERWIGSGRGHAISLRNSGIDHYTHPTPSETYIQRANLPPLRNDVSAKSQFAGWNRTPLMPLSSRPIVGFMHVAMKNHWKDIIKEQMQKLKISGLWDRTECIFVGLLGDGPDHFDFSNEKVRVAYHSADYGAAEVPTIAFLQQYCRTHQCLVYYIHTKGVFRAGPGQEEYRRAMEHFILLRHADCLKALVNHDTCGINFARCNWCQYYEGNFWWARSEYINSLPDILSLDVLPLLDPSPRHIAERWIGENPEIRAANLYNAHIYRGSNSV